MKRFFSQSFNFINQPTWKSHSHILSKNEIIPGTKFQQYKDRIDKLGQSLPKNSTAIIPSYKLKYGSQNIFYPFQQNNNLLYFTGFNEPDCCLIISKTDQSVVNVNFFVTSNDESSLLWSGPRAGIEGSKEIFGLQNTYDVKNLDQSIEELVKLKNHSIYIDYQADHSSLSQINYNKLKPSIKSSLERLILPLRLVKTTEELNLMKKSGNIACEAFKETMMFSKRAKSEAELAAFMEFKVRSLGAERLAYVPVVAGSNRGLVLHYTHNNQLLRDKNELENKGGWILMDAGALYFGYCSDITRSWPLSGRFTDAQARLYESVLQVQNGCQKALESFPGISFSQLNEIAMYLTATELEKLGFKEVENNVNRWFPHSIGHHLGLDLHDCPAHNPLKPFQPGNVITIEPGLYIPVDDKDAPREYRGLAIRIEDDFIIEDSQKLTNITEALPKTIFDIENLLK